MSNWWKWALGGFVALNVLRPTRRSPLPAPPRRGSGSPRTATPAAYGASKAAMLVARYRGQLGTALEKCLPEGWPQAAGFEPVPREVFLGFTAISTGPTENTTRAVATQAFHELGYFQTPAGPRDGPAPNPDPALSAWTRCAQGDFVKGLLGRPGTISTTAWGSAIIDQVAIGLCDLQSNYKGVAGSIDPALRPSNFGGTWAIAMAFSGFSAGAGTAARWINQYTAGLKAVPEAARFSKWAELIQRDIESGAASGWVKGKHKNPGATLIRTWQKLESGRAAADKMGTLAAYDEWYDRPDADAGAILRASF